MKKQLTFYFIRHGRTVWNEQSLMHGHGDSPLTEILSPKIFVES